MIDFDNVTTMSIVLPQEYINCLRDFITLNNVQFMHDGNRVTMSANANILFTTGVVMDGEFVSQHNNRTFSSDVFYGSYPEHWHSKSNDVIAHIIALVDYSLTNEVEDDTTWFGSIANMLEDKDDITQLVINHYMVGTMLMIDIDWFNNDDEDGE